MSQLYSLRSPFFLRAAFMSQVPADVWPGVSPRRALVLFSGGQDSTTCLAFALAHYAHVETIGFDYRQRHSIELKQRVPILERLRRDFPDWDARLGADHVVDASVLASLGSSALTEERAITMGEKGLLNTFVPGRNLLFLTLAAALGYRRQIEVLVGGMCETDFSGYPDCRDDAIKAMQLALNIGMAERFVIETPLMWIDKAATWHLADALGGSTLTDLIVDDTHTCYLGERGVRHAWGFGCDRCPACRLRADGYAKWQAQLTADL